MITQKDTSPRVQLLAALPWSPEGSVYEARLGEDGAPVVVAKLGDDPDVLARARCALSLQHPTIARNHGIVELEDGPALVQAVTRGQTLAELDDVARFRLQSTAVTLVDQLLAALEHAHELGVTHGDLRAEDVVVDGERVLLRRFGFARPSRPPSPRYDLVALGAALAPFIADDELRRLVTSPAGDAATLRRMLRETTAGKSASGTLGATVGGAAPSSGGASDPFAHTTASSPSAASRSRSSKPGEQPSITPDALVGRRLGDFVIREKLAEGGLGMVFRAEQPSLGRQVVIKVPFSKHGVSERLLLRFMHEAQLASRLDHPYAAHVYAFGHEPDGLMWIAMELVSGTPLDEYLRVRGAMPAAGAAAFVSRLCEVLHRAHELGIVHRDVKPSNVMVVQRSGRLLPKLLDFGIARDVSALRGSNPIVVGLSRTIDDNATTAPPGSLTIAGSVMGSPLYMAPEQWDDAAQAGPPADIYALGVLMFEVLTGKPPFIASTIGEVERLHKTQPPPPLPASTPRALSRAVERALAKPPAARFATALELGTELEAAVGRADAAPLPQVDASLRADFIERGPPPIADALAALDAARNIHQARSALDQLVDVVANWLGLLALASRSRMGAPPHGDAEPARELVRALGSRPLGAAEWVELARALTRPWTSRPQLHPLADLVAFLGSEATPLDVLVATRAGRHDLSEPAVRKEVADDVRTIDRLLLVLSFLLHVRVVVDRSPAPELWAGARRGPRPEIALAADRGREGEAILVDADGVPLVRLHPLVQVARPMAAAPEELFIAVDGERLVAPPHGFERAAPELRGWLRAELLAGGGDERGAEAADERPPYRGLEPFTAADADNFLGREREREEFLNRLRVQPLLAVVGRSGSGKSSFVQAGVVPHLPSGWRAVTMRPGVAPAATLQARLAAAGDATVLVVDQFEELFTLCHDADERQRFADALAALAARPDRRVVITLRDDFLLAAEALPALRERLTPGLVLLGPPARDDLERILVEPARRRGYEFDDPALPRKIVADVADGPGGLALLSFAAAQLWEQRDRHFRKLPARAYTAMGGVGGALAGHAEATLHAMSAGERALVRNIFRRLVTPEGTRAVVSKAEVVETLGDATRGSSAVEKLIAARLVVASEADDGTVQIEVAHETLLQAWPRLVQWRREDQEGARLRQQLREAARQWSERGRAQGLLWRDDALAELRLWQKRHGEGLSAIESSFAHASIAADERGRRRRRAAVAVAFVLMVAASGVLWTFYRRAERATAATRAQLVESLLAQARTKLIGGRRWEALANLVAAQKMGAAGPTVDLMRALARTPARLLERRFRANAGRTWSVDWSSDGHTLLTTGEDGAALWDAGAGTLRARLVGHEGSVRDGAFSPDGTRVATIGFDGTVRLWDAHTGAPLRTLHGHATIVRCLAWRGDGAQLISADDGGGLRIWDAANGATLASFATGGKISSCSVGGARFAVGNWNGKIFLVEDGQLVSLGHHEGLVRSVRFSNDGTLLVSASGDKTARVWDVAARRMVEELRGAGDALISAAFSPDGSRVVASARDGAARVWDATSGKLQWTLAGHQGVVWYAEFDGSGQRVLTSADDGSARVWDAASGALLSVLEGHDKAVLRARFSPDGKHVATASYDGTVAVWSSAAAHLEVSHAGWPSFAVDANGSESPDGATVGGREGTVVWLAASPGELAMLPPSALSAASRTRALTVDRDRKTARIWRLPSKEPLHELHANALIDAVAIDENRVALAGADGVHVFGSDGRALYGVAGPARTLLLLDDERWLAVSPSGVVRILRGGTVEAELSGPPAAAWHDGLVTLSPARDLVAFSGGSDLVLVHLGATPRLERLAGHQAPVLTARFDADGRRLVTASEDGTGAIWDLASGHVLRRLVPKSQYLADASFTGGGRLVTAADGQGALEFFDADSGQLVATVEGSGHVPLWLRVLDDDRVAIIGTLADLTVLHVRSDRDALAAVEHDLACKAPPAVQTGDCTR